jgi:hypothetical protein
VRLPVGGGVGGSGLGSIEDSSLVMLGYLCPRAPPPAVPFKWPKMTFRFMPQKDDKMGHRRLIAHRWRRGAGKFISTCRSRVVARG